jgi:hypothetical protein
MLHPNSIKGRKSSDVIGYFNFPCRINSGHKKTASRVGEAVWEKE